MKTAYFEIKGKIRGKARPRVTKQGHAYTPSVTADYEKLVQLAYKRQCGNIFFDKAAIPSIEIHIKALFEIPKSYTHAKRVEAMTNIIRPSKKPDVDNIAKIICDALNGVAYSDDSQIVNMRVDKLYTIDEERVQVWIKNI